MDSGQVKANIFSSVFTLANKLQLLGDRLDPALTVKQWLFLAGVMSCGPEPPTLSQIAACIGSSRQNVKKMALILVRQDFVSLEKDGQDARMLRVRLTEACQAHLRQREAMEARFIHDLFANFTSAELGDLAALLQKLAANAEQMGQDHDETEA